MGKIRVKICVSAEMLPDFVSYSIMRWLGFKGSHIFIEFKGKMYHAIGAGICDGSFTEWCKTHYITHEKEVQLNCTETEFLEWYEKHKGIPYSDSQYIGFLLSPLRRFVRNKRKKAICSEFVCWLLADLAGRSDFKDADFLDPKEVFKRI